MAYNTQEMSKIRVSSKIDQTALTENHEPSAESTVNKNNTIFPITEQLVFIMTLFDRSVTYVQRLIGHSILGD